MYLRRSGLWFLLYWVFDRFWSFPMKPPGNHQMQNEPKIVFQPHTNPFTQPAQCNHLAAFDAGDWRYGRAQQKRRFDLDALNRATLYAFFDRVEVNNDVGEFR